MQAMGYLEIYLKRLLEDEKDMSSLVARCPAIEYRNASPDVVEVHYKIAGLHRLPNNEIVVANEHYAQFFRTPAYPVFSGPLVRMTTPGVQHVHPNIDPLSGTVCYGLEPEYWAPSLGLDDIALMVARMLRLETFNLLSVFPAAVEEAEYVRQLSEQGQLPLDKEPLLVGEQAGTSEDQVGIDEIEIEEEAQP